MNREDSPDTAAREALRLLKPAPDDWVPPVDGIDHDVVIVGGGQGGSAFAFALRRAGIRKVLVIDAAHDASAAGIWRSRARMKTLRTAKNLVGPELDVTALGFQNWYEARNGQDAYAALTRIPTSDWSDYLDWFRQFLDIPVLYRTQLLHVGPHQGLSVSALRLDLTVDGVPQQVCTRKLILCTGNAGSGEPYVPEILHEARLSGLAAHTADAIDFTQLRGKHVAVIGAAASAFDAAAVALEAGAAAVDLFARRHHIAARAIAKPRGYTGFYDNFHTLPDAVRWGHALRLRRAGTTPPVDAVKRAMAHDGFRLHLNATWNAARVEGGQVAAQVGGEKFTFDFVIAGTGYSNDLRGRPELADISPLIARWSDRFMPAPGEEDEVLGAQPYLSPELSLNEKTPGTAGWLNSIHVFNPSGSVSAGGPLGDVPSIKRDIPSAVRGISRDLFLEDLGLHEQRASAEVEPDFGPDLYARALWPGAYST